jgi:ribosome recycling factor
VSDDVIKDSKQRFSKALDHLSDLLRSVRTGRASASLVDNVRVDYYGTPTPLNQVASVTTPEARTIVIKPFDLSAIKEIEKALSKSDLGAAPTDDGKVVRITLPPLSGDQRQKFAAKVKEMCEETRVAMRNVRREMNKHIDQQKKDGDLTEDEHRKVQDDIQSLLKDWEKKVDEVHDKKVADILE